VLITSSISLDGDLCCAALNYFCSSYVLVAKRLNSFVEPLADRNVCYPLVFNCLVERSRYVNTVLVRYFPQRPYDVLEACKLAGAD